MNDAGRLQVIRSQLAAIQPADWSIATDRDGAFVEARGPMGELWPVARFHAGASTDEMQFAASAPSTVRFLLGLVDRAIDKLRPAPPLDDRPREEPPKDYAAEAAMKCAEPAFRVFLETCHGLERPLTEERVAQKVRSILGVTSRSELNRDATAAARWKDLRRAFDAWRKAGH